MMTTWSVPALVLIGIALGPYGLNLLTAAVLQLLDPIVAMALAMVGVFVGFEAAGRRSATLPAILLIAGATAMVALRDPSFTGLAIGLSMMAVAAVVALAGWLLVGQTDSEREQQVFVVGALLLLGGAAAYVSLSALFAGLIAGFVWSVAGPLAKARIVRELDYFQHLLLVLLLLAAGASAVFTTEVLALGAVIAALHFLRQPATERFPAALDLVAIALVFDLFRGATP